MNYFQQEKIKKLITKDILEKESNMLTKISLDTNFFSKLFFVIDSYNYIVNPNSKSIYDDINNIDKQYLTNEIEKHVNEIKEFDCVDHYIDEYFAQSVSNGEYYDNSLDLSYAFRILTEISNDEWFFEKLYYVIDTYINK